MYTKLSNETENIKNYIRIYQSVKSEAKIKTYIKLQKNAVVWNEKP